MKNNSFPWFPFYATDWATSEDVMEMTMAERGVYITLLATQWRCDNELPADCKKLAIHCGTDSRTIANWMKKWGKLFPILHQEGCTCDTPMLRERNADATPTSHECSADAALTQRGCNKRANIKLYNLRKKNDLGESNLPRQDKTKEKQDKIRGDETTAADTIAAADSPSLPVLFKNLVEESEAVQSLVSQWNELKFTSKYKIPAKPTSVYSNLVQFVQASDWQPKFQAIINSYKNSEFLQRGGDVGALNSLPWLFNKNYVENIEAITSGKYNSKKDTDKEEYAAKNSFLVNNEEADIKGTLVNDGWKVGM
jgi:uncharacterized protein YdaU (DUF1376 family)